MNISVLGVGAIGGYIGGRLVEAGLPVSFLVRKKRAEQLRQTGIQIKSIHGDFSSKAINVYTDPEAIPKCDVIILSVKGYHIQSILPELKVLVKKGAKVLPFLNGMEHFQLLADELGPDNVLGGFVFTFSTLDEAGAIVQTSDLHDYHIGALEPSQETFCKELAQTMAPAKLNVICDEAISYDLWKKYMFINALSSITTASRLPVGEVRKVTETLNLYKQILLDMQSLAKAYSVNLSDDEVDSYMEQIQAFSEEKTSSMHQDFRKGLPIEVEHLQGGALRMAEKKNLKLPSIEAIYALLKPYEQGT